MLQESHKLEVYATRIAQTGSLCYKNRAQTGTKTPLAHQSYQSDKTTNWKFMLQESHKLEVYEKIGELTKLNSAAADLCTNPNRGLLPTNYKNRLQEPHKLEVYATRIAQTKSLCYKNRTNWKFMLQETRIAQTGSLCYKKETFSIRNGIIFSVGACCARDTSYRSITAE